MFDRTRHLCTSDVHFTTEGAILTVRWSKVIQFRQRTLQVPLPKIPYSTFCPSTALLQLMLDNPVPSSPVPSFRYSWGGANHVPLTQKRFSDKLRCCLRALGIPSSDYSSHGFRTGGASFGLQCGLTSDLIKLQGNWSSNLYERYLQPSFELRKQVS